MSSDLNYSNLFDLVNMALIYSRVNSLTLFNFIKRNVGAIYNNGYHKCLDQVSCVISLSFANICVDMT